MSGAFRTPIFVAIMAALAVAVIGGGLTDVGPWYQELKKPSLNPPNWAFAPAWTMIYAFGVFAAVIGWDATSTNAERAWLISLFFINAVLNILWSTLFFAVHRPDWALAEVATLWLSVLALILFFVRFSKLAALALFPLPSLGRLCSLPQSCCC